MDEKTLQRLEFHKITGQLEQHALTPPGKRKASSLLPATETETVAYRLKETEEGFNLLRMEPNFPFSVRDIESPLQRLRAGGVLSAQELFIFYLTLKGAKATGLFLQEKRDRYRLLGNIALAIEPMQAFEDAAAKNFTESGDVADNATPILASLRQKIRVGHERVKGILEGMLRSAKNQKYLQEPIITQRNERYVLPVKQENRKEIPGIIHDQSASGATVFVEPFPVVEKYNEVKRLEAEEKAEVERILRYLTALLAGDLDKVEATWEAVGHIDFILAKARLARTMKANPPALNDKGFMNLISARHPLLKGEAVPVSVWLGKDFRILVITGPNTGGKTVALKTLGLLTLMAQSGLFVPASERSEIAIFQDIFADIGDEQSIEQSLSTFSSHLSNIIRFLGRVDNNTLLLLDELGSGTDPREGAALAMAVLEELLVRECRAIATTHYSELKHFAFTKPQVENASVEFDPETFQPTFRLIIGQPGHSSAFAIARGLGMPEKVVERARGLLSREEAEVGDLIVDLQAKNKAAEEKLAQAEMEKKEAEALRRKQMEELEGWENKKSSLMDKAHREAESVIRGAKAEVRALIEDIKDGMAEDKAKALEEAHKLALVLEETREKHSDQAAEARTTGEVLNTVRVGQQVYIPKLNQRGSILTLPNEQGEVQVEVGRMRITSRLADLRGAGEIVGQVKAEAVSGNLVLEKARQVRPELDLRGLTVDEAGLEVEKYLDDASLGGLRRVTLIHGKGTGALRKAMKDILARSPLVASYRLGDYQEGGMGVTVVELK